jgi:hypothetical protein
VEVLDDGLGDGEAVVGARPAPISSRTTRLRAVAWLRMFAVSSISTMKVLWPVAMSSWAPIRVKIRSTRPTLALAAGTKEPIWASRTVRATCRSHELLPAMFGPVRMTIWSSPPTAMSLAT